MHVLEGAFSRTVRVQNFFVKTLQQAELDCDEQQIQKHSVDVKA
jgi:hypothetical protein